MTIIDDIIRREGKATNDLDDSGGRTKYGISETSNPAAWADGDITLDEARAIYTEKYINKPGFNQLSGLLQEFMVDWGVVSGPTFVITKLQEVLGVTTDGVIGPITLVAINNNNPTTLVNRLVDLRIIGAAKIAQARPKDLKYLLGWINRALEFRRY